MAASDTVLLVGAGNMGGALLTGWFRSGIPGASVTVLDPSAAPRIQSAIADAGSTLVTHVPQDLSPDVLFLALKPQMMGSALPALAKLVGPQTVVVSVAAGTTIASLSEALGNGATVRAMPNTPAMVGRGITGAFANDKVTAEQRDLVHRLLKVSGPVEWVESETDIDLVTAVSGSGPAYVFYLVECMAEAGRKLGLPADLAMRLARETVAGAGELLHQSSDAAADLRRNVTSPGGTTAAALAVLTEPHDGMQPLFDRAIAAARERAEELSR
ncbi:pyrroline-5-carboxylate reductase [Rhizobium halophytocola]|uniref:Pyrroline-5-carboxylate reductase n=2 Tax=Rhizobium halophytocola TaxID=735519 RepID=A0ABS4E3X3_9HYPH|nr:pyrroline-5-carboxylate reductase [Rhizobium halophytocola]